MDFDSFVDKIKSKLAEEAEGRLLGYEVEFDVTAKVNGAKKSVRGGKCGEKIMKNLYLDELYADYIQDMNFEDVIDDIIDIIRDNHMPLIGSEFIDLVNNPKEVKKLISYFVINQDFNRDLLENVPHRTILDLAVIYKFTLYNGEDSVGKVIITEDMAEKWGLTEADLYEIADVNTEKLCPYVVKKIASDFIIVTNESAVNGASAIINDDLIKSIAEEAGEDIYIVPSSIHDLIILKKSMHSQSEILSVIKHVNDDVVNREDILSYNLYFYSLEEGNIQMIPAEYQNHVN